MYATGDPARNDKKTCRRSSEQNSFCGIIVLIDTIGTVDLSIDDFRRAPGREQAFVLKLSDEAKKKVRCISRKSSASVHGLLG